MRERERGEEDKDENKEGRGDRRKIGKEGRSGAKRFIEERRKDSWGRRE